jgi:FKBP-type peptidyl-prolyl cis-trans isomerase
MKKLVYFLLAGLITLTWTSCLNDDNAQADKKWRDENIAAYEKTTNDADFIALGRVNEGPSGIYYKDLNKGDNTVVKGTEHPIQTSKVKVRYSGEYHNGTVFDKGTGIAGTPVEFDLTSVIRGFSVALQNMVVGDKWDICIPWYLGYGSSGMTNYYGQVVIKGYTTLYFRNVELVEITMYP